MKLLGRSSIIWRSSIIFSLLGLFYFIGQSLPLSLVKSPSMKLIGEHIPEAVQLLDELVDKTTNEMEANEERLAKRRKVEEAFRVLYHENISCVSFLF